MPEASPRRSPLERPENGSFVSETPLIANSEAPVALSGRPIKLAIGIVLLTVGLGLLRREGEGAFALARRH